MVSVLLKKTKGKEVLPKSIRMRLHGIYQLAPKEDRVWPIKKRVD